jgi:hypothetical protein
MSDSAAREDVTAPEPSRAEQRKRKKARLQAKIDRRIALQERDADAGRRAPPHPDRISRQECAERAEQKLRKRSSPNAALLTGATPVNSQAALAVSRKKHRP